MERADRAATFCKRQNGALVTKATARFCAFFLVDESFDDFIGTRPPPRSQWAVFYFLEQFLDNRGDRADHSRMPTAAHLFLIRPIGRPRAAPAGVRVRRGRLIPGFFERKPLISNDPAAKKAWKTFGKSLEKAWKNLGSGNP
jgi:hypothetical protein